MKKLKRQAMRKGYEGMYYFLVVDDEYYVRQRVKLCIPWQDYGFEFAGEVSSAARALEFVRENEVDLAIVDISMPGRNGIDLIHDLKVINDKIKIIILSGFATFEYAKQAIEYGVVNYLLKPINTEELIRTITEIKASLDKDASVQQEQKYYIKTKDFVENASKNAFFRSLFAERLASDHYDRDIDLEWYGILPSREYFIIVFDIFSSDVKVSSIESLNVNRQTSLNIINGIVNRYCASICTVDAHNHQVLICNRLPESVDKMEILEEAVTRVRDSLHVCTIMGYSAGSGYQGTMDGIERSYKEALYFFTFKTIYGVDQNISNAMVPIKKDWVLNNLNEKLKNCLETGDKDDLFHNLDEIFKVIKRNLYCIQALESEISNLLSIGINYASRKNLQFFIAENEWVLYSCSEITHAGNNLQDIKKKIVNLFVSLIEEPCNTNHPLIYQIVMQAAEIIERDFCRCDMGLQYISSVLLISPAYLSRNFKKIQGITVSKYIMKCRMERAKTMLEQTNMTAAQISEEIGFHDFFYFSKCAKEYFGVSPSQYRMSHSLQETAKTEEQGWKF